MKILFVITSLLTGGAEKLMVDLLPRLRSADNDVELVVFDGTSTPFFDQLEKTGTKIHALTVGGSVYNPFHILSLRRIMKDFDIVHSHNTSPQLFTAIAGCFWGKKKPILITTEHNTTNRRRNYSIFKLFDRWMYNQYQSIICISDQARTNLRNYLPSIQDKLVTIYNGVDTERFSISERYDKRDYGNVIVSMVAAFREQKDQKTLIRAMAKLPDHFLLRLIGTGEKSLVDSCRDLANSLGIGNRIHFLGMRTDIPELLSSSDIVVLSSHYEGLSLSSIEGMASGRPFVASDVDGLHEIVDGYGILFEHENAKQLSEIIKSIAEDQQFALSIGAKCRERARQYDIHSMVEQYNQIYKSFSK